MTEELLQSMCQSSFMSTLEELNVQMTCNFETDEACLHLASLIDTASCLKKLDVSAQQGERKIQVVIEYAVSPNKGLIKIKDGDRVVCEIPTNKTDAQKIEIFA